MHEKVYHPTYRAGKTLKTKLLTYNRKGSPIPREDWVNKWVPYIPAVWKQDLIPRNELNSQIHPAYSGGEIKGVLCKRTVLDENPFERCPTQDQDSWNSFIKEIALNCRVPHDIINPNLNLKGNKMKDFNGISYGQVSNVLSTIKGLAFYNRMGSYFYISDGEIKPLDEAYACHRIPVFAELTDAIYEGDNYYYVKGEFYLQKETDYYKITAEGLEKTPEEFSVMTKTDVGEFTTRLTYVGM